jgi:hypothetical protein
MTTPIGCTLYVNGARVADGTPGDRDDAPTALSGLSMTWGRATTVDQVEPSTCSFQLLDPPGGGSFLNLLHTGAAVQVRAAADVPGSPGEPVNIDGGFESAPLNSDLSWTDLYSGHTARATNVRAHTGRQSATIIDQSAPPNTVTFDSGIIPPAATSSNVSAWDHIQTMQPDETWTVSAWVYPPVDGTVTVQPAAYSSPTGQTFTPRVGPRVDVPWNAAQPWQYVAVDYTAAAGDAGKWIGLGLTLDFAAWSDVAAATTWNTAASTWTQWRTWYIDDVAMTPPADTDPVVHRDVTVFSGRITDLDAGYDPTAGAVVCSVTAADFTADLAQRDVSAEPWPAETLSARFAHIIAGAGLTGTVDYTIAPTLSGWSVSYLDVDRQQCWPLLADLATSVDGVLWSATHRTSGPYLWLADPRVQSALYVLYVGDDGLVHVGPTGAAAAAIELDACDVLLDPVVFKQAVSDVVTRVALSWQEQTVDDKGQPAPTDRTNTLIDAALENDLGTRRAAVSTQLVSSTDADSVAALILGRLRLQSWRVGGLTWNTATSDMNADQTVRTLDLLDGTSRLAAPILLTNLADWSPTGGGTLPLLLQGGTYVFDAGYWTLNLVTSSAAAQGTSLTWTDVDPAYDWTDIGGDVSWTDLAGVAAQ